MIEDFKVQWFPGHMTKARRMMENHLRLVDVVIEILDARIPRSSSNPTFEKLIGSKPKILAFNKIDLADATKTKLWLGKFENAGIPVCAINCSTGLGIKQLVRNIRLAAEPVVAKWRKRGVLNRIIRVMIIGIPNVGKSSLINRLVGSAKVTVADRPGVTRGQQWVTIGKGLELLDTPGVLWPKFEDAYTGFCLAVTGAIKEDVYDRGQAAELLVMFLAKNYPESLCAKYNIKITPSDLAEDLMAKIAASRGFLRPKGALDHTRVIQLLLRDFRTGDLGSITLDEP